MGNDSEYETDSGSEYEEDSEYETDDEEQVVVKTSSPSKKEPQPCQHYRVDVTAARFGDCKCGWPKAAHGPAKQNKAAEALARLKSGRQLAPVNSGGGGPCGKFIADVTAKEFGVCKICGFKQRDHHAKGENKARAALKSLKSVPINSTSLRGDKPCDNYNVDPNGKRFGDCRCGFSKADHQKKGEDFAAQALRNLKAKNKGAHEEEDRLAAGMQETAASGGWEVGGKKKKKKQQDEKQDEQDTAKSAPKACCVVM